MYYGCDLQKQVPAKPEDVSIPQLGDISDEKTKTLSRHLRNGFQLTIYTGA